jgi:hypothetical protein
MDRDSSNIEIDPDNFNCWDNFTIILVRIFANSNRVLLKSRIFRINLDLGPPE